MFKRNEGGSGRSRSAAFGAVVLALAFAGSASAQARPDFSGIWSRGAGGNQTVIPPEAYELTAEGRAVQERNAAAVAGHDPEIDTALRCLPTGFPRMMIGLPFVLAQSDQTVVIVHEADPLARVIYLDAEHRSDYWPTYNGDAVGRWEGDTLVVETVNLEPTTFLDMRGLPHSENLRIVERIRLVEPDLLEDQFTVYDDRYFVRPFTFTRTFARADDQKPVENVCENARGHPAEPNG